MSVVWAATSPESGLFDPVERRTEVKDLSDRFNDLRSCGQGYVEVRSPDREFPALTLAISVSEIQPSSSASQTAAHCACGRPPSRTRVACHRNVPGRGGGASGPASPGWCDRSRVYAGRRRTRGRRTPCPRSHGPVGSVVGLAPHAAPGYARAADGRRRRGALTGSEQEGQRPAAAVVGQMELGGQSASGSTEGVIVRFVRPLGPPCRPVAAACWWARTMVESICTSQPTSPAASA